MKARPPFKLSLDTTRFFRKDGFVLKKKILPYLTPFACALLATLAIELLSQRSIDRTLGFLFLRPHLLLLNVLILSLLYLPMLILRKKVFYATSISAILVAVGITNFVLQSFRVTPFVGTDLFTLTTGFDIISFYLSPLLISLILGGLAAAVFVLAVLYLKTKRGVRHPIGAPVAFITTLALTFSLSICYGATGVIPKHFPNIVDAYREYGFTYCFLNTVFDRGIDKPKSYSAESIEAIMGRAGLSESPSLPSEMPNVIFVQLESFFDVRRVTDVTFSEDPTPNFSALLENYPSGYLAVPSIGAGTANTEFEVISGMNLASFGAGEYPYNTILRDTACESIPYVLGSLGYGTHAIHNNRATFYGRDICFTNLGFESFTPVEYMPGLTEDDFNPLGWAKDRVLTEEILASLSSTDGPDYIYTISVQGHGGYPSRELDQDLPIRVTGGLSFEDEIAAWEYYVNQLHEMDLFIGELTAAVDALGEKTVVVFYGDHLPGGLGVESTALSGPSIYHTEYAVYSNFPLSFEGGELEAFQLASVVLDAVGIKAGNIIRLHQTCRGETDYLEMLESIEYDILYGKQYVYGEEGSPYGQTELSFGARPIKIESVSVSGDTVTVVGENFTLSSRIAVDGEPLKTTRNPDGSLSAKLSDDLEAGDAVTVAQYTSENTYLGETDPFYYE